jgi:hypothetical protein
LEKLWIKQNNKPFKEAVAAHKLIPISALDVVDFHSPMGVVWEIKILGLVYNSIKIKNSLARLHLVRLFSFVVILKSPILYILTLKHLHEKINLTTWKIT